ncbi:MAG: Leu/Phe/Val dehydrogenase [Longimicrobiales bacterium]
MQIFDRMSRHEHEQLVLWNEPKLGYRGIVAVHDTTLGPALGGTRFWNYGTDEEAIIDALRLARGMTYKAAITGLNLGGGKSVIIGNNRTNDREMIFRAHGRAVESLKGRYITAEDVGTSVDDMEFVKMETDHVAGLLGRSGDPSPVTAHGVYKGIKACAKERYGDDSLDGKHVAVQGLGHVGHYLCQYLTEDGARLTVTDIRPERVAAVTTEFGAESVSPDDIYGVDAEIFAPCALGAVVNDDTLKVFKYAVIAGAANNQLAQARHGQELHQKSILYAPDYVINAGGLVNVYGELQGWDPERSKRKAGDIYNTLLRIFKLSGDENVPTSEAADRVAESRLREARQLQKSWV